MTNFIPIFPLDIVVYPDELLKINIFTPRYRKLINDCIEENKPFGIAMSAKDKMYEFGTLVEVDQVVEKHADGSMDIRIKGLRVFRVLEIVNHLPEKPYWGAIVNYPENDKMKVHPNLSKLIYDEVKRLYTLLNIENMLPKDFPEWTSYDIAHKLGLTREQEYELLSIFNEVQRMEYLRRYFNSIIPDINDLETLKSRISLN